MIKVDKNKDDQALITTKDRIFLINIDDNGKCSIKHQ